MGKLPLQQDRVAAIAAPKAKRDKIARKIRHNGRREKKRVDGNKNQRGKMLLFALKFPLIESTQLKPRVLLLFFRGVKGVRWGGGWISRQKTDFLILSVQLQFQLGH